MQSATLNKITLGTLGLLLTVSIGFGIHQSNQASWQAVAAQTNTVSLQVTTENKQLVSKFNKLAASTSAAATAPAAVAVSAQATPLPVAVAQPAPAAAPTSQAS